MNRLVRTLRLDTAKRTSANVWIIFLGIFFLMGMNFNRLAIAELVLKALMTSLGVLQVLSLVFYGYHSLVNRHELRPGEGVEKSLYFVLLLLVSALSLFVVKKVTF